jgi:modulator of FtsH protease
MLNTTTGFTDVSSTTSVLKNTYRLLSLTLIFSAFTAYLGTMFPLGGLGQLVLFIAAIGILFTVRAFKDSGIGVLLVFAFTGLMGFSMGPMLNHYLNLPNGSVTVGLAMLATGASFLGLSAYVHISKRDFGFMGGFLFVALIALIVVGLINLFFPVPGLSLVLAYVSALLFSAYILYDTSEIINGRQTNYLFATIALYLDILNLFSALLRILGISNDD